MSDPIALQALMLAVEALQSQLQSLALRVTQVEALLEQDDQDPDAEPTRYMDGTPV